MNDKKLILNEYILKKLFLSNVETKPEFERVFETLDMMLELDMVKEEYKKEICQMLHDEGY